MYTSRCEVHIGHNMYILQSVVSSSRAVRVPWCTTCGTHAMNVYTFT
jgi:hypothetical protein